MTATLTLWQLVRQSVLIHPDWCTAEHLDWLDEHGHGLPDPDELRSWLTRPEHPGYARHGVPVTKWQLCGARERAELDAEAYAEPLPCAGCGEPLHTEGEFARHFVLHNPQYRNWGYCPVKGP